LLGAANAWANEKARAEAERLAKKEVRRKRAEATAREERLDSLAGKEASLWARVENLIDSKLPKSYDEAVNLLVDLRDLDSRNKGVDFSARIEALRRKHARKPTLIERLKAGL
jgi:seryl-tRNA synthetase